jgi:hypothetical protein
MSLLLLFRTHGGEGTAATGFPVSYGKTRKKKKKTKEEIRLAKLAALEAKAAYEDIAIEAKGRQDIAELKEKLRKKKKTETEILLLLQFMFHEED